MRQVRVAGARGQGACDNSIENTLPFGISGQARLFPSSPIKHHQPFSLATLLQQCSHGFQQRVLICTHGKLPSGSCPPALVPGHPAGKAALPSHTSYPWYM